MLRIIPVLFSVFALLVFSSCKKEAVKSDPPIPVVKLIVSTDSVVNITDSSATIKARIISAGSDTITLRGVCWDTAVDPDTSDNFRVASQIQGDFQVTVSGLLPGKKYYSRAFAKTSVGISYGNTIQFETDTIVPDLSCPPTVSDIDGNVYHTVKIGAQCWFKENLRTSKYRNGDGIKFGFDNAAWAATSIGSVTSYNEDSSQDSTYGKLYNLYAVVDSRKLCPAGWHVPNDAEWTVLVNYLGGGDFAGGKMKTTGTSLWASPNAGASNTSGFSAVPTGIKNSSGIFELKGSSAFFWANRVGNNVHSRALSSSDGKAPAFVKDAHFGFSVRCIAD